MTRVLLNAGACGFDVIVEATRIDKHRVRVLLHTACAPVAAMGPDLEDLNCLGRGHDVLLPPDRSAVYRAASRHGLHPACPVPAAILKAIEVALGLNLPCDVTLRFVDDDDEP